MSTQADLTLKFLQHICDTVDFHRENDGLTYAAVIGVLAIVQHKLLAEVMEEDDEDDEEADEYHGH